LVKQENGGQFILIKSAIHQNEITIINMYVPNVSAPSIIKHILKDLKTHTDSDTVVVADLDIPLSPINRSSKQKINKEILEKMMTQIKWTLLMSTKYFIQQQHNIYSSQLTMELSPK
jgi:hypothetical protein